MVTFAELKSPAANAMRLPSGDHAGAPCPPGGMPTLVRGLGTPPCEGTNQRTEGGIACRFGSMLGIALDSKAIDCPSDDQLGWEPNCVKCLATPPSAGTNQMPPRSLEQ